MKTCVGIIGGSGLYDLKSLQNTKWIDVKVHFFLPLYYQIPQQYPTNRISMLLKN